MRTVLPPFVVTLALALTALPFPACAAGDAPAYPSADSRRASPEVPKARGTVEQLPEQAKDPEARENASAGASSESRAGAPERRAGTDLGYEAEKEEEGFRNKPRPLKLVPVPGPGPAR